MIEAVFLFMTNLIVAFIKSYNKMTVKLPVKLKFYYSETVGAVIENIRNHLFYLYPGRSLNIKLILYCKVSLVSKSA